MYELRIQKNRLRTQYIERRAALDTGIRSKLDERICSLFTSLVTYRYSDVLLLYVPTRCEIDVLPIAKMALDTGKTVAFPCCEPDTRAMVFRIVSSLEQLTAKGSYGIPEPDEACPVYSSALDSRPAVCVVPAIVYDRRGYRIGYGKGYYDRYLPCFAGTKVGFAYSDFIVPNVPCGRFDLAVNVLVTEKGVKALNAV